MKLCCFFNYPPLYRQNVYKAIDQEFDAQFCFGKEVEYTKNSGIAKLDFTIFKRKPIEFDNKIYLKYFLWRPKLIKQLFKGYDAFLITGDLCYSYIPFIIGCKILGKKVYGWGHGPKHKKGVLTLIFWWVLTNLTGFFCYGERGRQRLIDLGYKPQKTFTIYNSLNCNTEEAKSGRLKSDIISTHFNNALPTVLFVGRLTPQKKIDNLIKIASAHREKGINYNLLIIGDGPESAELKKLSEATRMQHQIWFYGECYDESKLNELIYNCDVCCSPGNVGLTALHAMTYGVPVISNDDFETQMPEYETIVPQKTGLFFEKNNWDDLADKISFWITNYSDDGNRSEIRQNCFEMIDNKWNVQNQINILKKVLNGNAE